MNKKLNKFLKNPLLILSSVLLVVGLVVVITLNCISVCAGKYTNTTTTTVLGQEVKTTSTYQFKGDKVIMTQTINGTTNSQEMQYEVKDGELYLIGELLGGKTKVGKINAFKITSLISEDDNIKLVNKGAVAFNVIAIIVLVVGALGVVTSLVYTKLSDKKKTA